MPGDGFSSDDEGAAPGDLTSAEVVALDEADGIFDELAWHDDDVPPEAAEPDGDVVGVAEPWDAGFTHGVPGAAGCGFESGGVVDRMLPGRHLAAFTGDALAAGLGELSDDELIGFMAAARRNTSWQQALELAAVAALDERRTGPDGRPGEHVAAEVAAELRLTGRGAEDLLALAAGVTRLSQVPAALAAGVIDLPRAAVFARELLVLDDELAVAAEAMVMPRAGEMTTGQLAARLQRAVHAVDPAAAERRKQRAEKDARVEAWAEPGRGTAGLAGRDLPAAEVIAADKRITAAARWLKAHGAKASMDWLRSRAYMGFLVGYSLDDLLAAIRARDTDAPRHDDGNTDPASPDNTDGSGSAGDRPCDTDYPDSGAGRPCDADQPGNAEDRLCDIDHPGSAEDRLYDADGSGGAADRPCGIGDGAAPAGGGRVPPGLVNPGVPAGLAELTGSVNLIMPALAWLGLSDAPGEITGTPAGGPADATTCRDLATALAGRPDARWCLTLTDPAGRAIAHGCARRGPASPSPGGLARAGPGPPDMAEWLRSITLIPIERGPAECAHRLEVPGYRPSPRLRHQVKTRSPRCSFQGCRRPAVTCDDDHTLAWLDGGRTCECNLSPLCRMHHRAKQAEGWHLSQARPGTLVWTLPSGRTYTTEPEPYLV